MIDLDSYPSRLCGGVYIDELEAGGPGGYVPVVPSTTYYDHDQGYALWEYQVPDGHARAGEIRACLLYVPQNGTAPGWKIIDGASDGRYYEVHQAVSGEGVFYHDSRFTGGRAEYLPQRPRDRLAEPLIVRSGESFSVLADIRNRRTHRLGVAVLAVFPGAPHLPEYESEY